MARRRDPSRQGRAHATQAVGEAVVHGRFRRVGGVDDRAVVEQPRVAGGVGGPERLAVEAARGEREREEGDERGEGRATEQLSNDHGVPPGG